MSHPFQNQDDALEELESTDYEETRKDIHDHLLAGYLSRDEGSAAILLNIYRLNYGGDPEGFGEWIGALPVKHFWHAEYARANLA